MSRPVHSPSRDLRRPARKTPAIRCGRGRGTGPSADELAAGREPDARAENADSGAPRTTDAIYPDHAQRRSTESRIHPTDSANNPEQRVPPASRDASKTGRPDCSKLQGSEKSECERRDTTR